MVTLLILFGAIGHIIGFADGSSGSVRDAMHTTPDRRLPEPSQPSGHPAKLTTSAPRRKN